MTKKNQQTDISNFNPKGRKQLSRTKISLDSKRKFIHSYLMQLPPYPGPKHKVTW
jgi:hypothetical protein